MQILQGNEQDRRNRENRIESESCCLYQAIAFFIVTIFVTFKRNVMNKDGTKRRMKSPEKPVNTRALKKTRSHKAKRVFSVYRNGKFNKFADDK